MKNCAEILEALSAYIDGELELKEMMEVKKHIFSCVSCRDEYEALLEVRELCREMDEIEPPEDFKFKLHNRLVEISAEESRLQAGKTAVIKPFFGMMHLKVLSTIAACFLIVFLARNILQSPVLKSEKASYDRSTRSSIMADTEGKGMTADTRAAGAQAEKSQVSGAKAPEQVGAMDFGGASPDANGTDAQTAAGTKPAETAPDEAGSENVKSELTVQENLQETLQQAEGQEAYNMALAQGASDSTLLTVGKAVNDSRDNHSTESRIAIETPAPVQDPAPAADTTVNNINAQQNIEQDTRQKSTGTGTALARPFSAGYVSRSRTVTMRARDPGAASREVVKLGNEYGMVEAPAAISGAGAVGNQNEIVEQVRVAPEKEEDFINELKTVPETTTSIGDVIEKNMEVKYRNLENYELQTRSIIAGLEGKKLKASEGTEERKRIEEELVYYQKERERFLKDMEDIRHDGEVIKVIIQITKK